MANVLVTGANRGIGLELCRLYAERGDNVYAACRKAGTTLRALQVNILEGLDVCDRDSIARLRSQLDGVQLNLLVNNAGILVADDLASFEGREVLRQFEVNALGPVRVTRALLDCLGVGARIGIVTSRMGSIADNSSGGYYGYRMSKVAVNMAGVSLAHDLRARGIAVAMIHPGMVATQMTGGQGIPAVEAARGLLRRLDALDLDSSGGFWHANGERLPW